MDDPSSSGLGNFHRVPHGIPYSDSNEGDSDSFESLPPPIVDFDQYKVERFLQAPMCSVGISYFSTSLSFLVTVINSLPLGQLKFQA